MKRLADRSILSKLPGVAIGNRNRHRVAQIAVDVELHVVRGRGGRSHNVPAETASRRALRTNSNTRTAAARDYVRVRLGVLIRGIDRGVSFRRPDGKAELVSSPHAIGTRLGIESRENILPKASRTVSHSLPCADLRAAQRLTRPRRVEWELSRKTCDGVNVQQRVVKRSQFAGGFTRGHNRLVGKKIEHRAGHRTVCVSTFARDGLESHGRG